MGVSMDCPNFLDTPIISGTGKATDLRFGGYIYRANPNKSPLKIMEKRERGRIQGLPKFFGYPLLFQERINLRTSNFEGTFIWWIRTTRKLCCRKDDRAMRPIYGCPENFRDSLTTPKAIISNIFHGFCSD